MLTYHGVALSLLQHQSWESKSLEGVESQRPVSPIEPFSGILY